MKKIILLYCDGTYQIMDEKELTDDKLYTTSYVLIPISGINRSYTCVAPSKYMIFSKAYISYTLCMIYKDEANYDFLETEDMDTITVETDSICDLFGLLNSASRLNLVNEMLSDKYTFEDTWFVGIKSLEVILTLNGKEIYSERFLRKGTSSVAYDYPKVIKPFKKLYDERVINDIWFVDGMLCLNKSEKYNTWEIRPREKSYSDLTGFPCVITNSITFATKSEMKILNKLEKDRVEFHMEFLIFYARSDRHAEICEYIEQGNVHKLEELIDLCEEYFTDVTMNIGSCEISRHKYDILEIFSNVLFVFEIVSLLFKAIYGDTEPAHPCREYIYDSALEVQFLNADRVRSCFLLNQFNMLTFSEILQIIESGLEGHK